ncbi:Threonine/homoserine/homoserine lactone efflux protein [Micromonospora pallida]|uniref:Threonine/homoserine/homoserine lactone efflux protein n=1 Tax=Micromonospora pallida TaxID=145854 RepID=A0A1C6SEF8_9ACTN|nr:LysE family translocator [Micromonospora pallida]SCL27797.1 Threonine/homoserine/homoserine lactone efflux protein [Micromonospora pallida]
MSNTGRVFTFYLAAVGALVLLTLLPGPDVAVVTRFALGGGVAAGARAAVGVVGGLAAWGVLTVVGLAAVLAASATAYTVVKLAGAVFLVGMGVRMLWRSRRRDSLPTDARPAEAGHAARSGLLTNVLNPKIAVFYTGLLPSLVPAGGSPRLWLPLLVLTHAVLSLAWLVGYAAVLSRSRSVLGRPGVRTVLDRVTGCVLIGFGVRVAAEAR